VGIFISASETHNHKNVNCSIDEHLKRLVPVFERASLPPKAAAMPQPRSGAV
jgi:isopropylmalate/homocitrate/citramalate synthase